MKFTLHYRGELRASGNKPRLDDKWKIRRQIHPQLKELWATNPALRGLHTETVLPAKGPFLQEFYHHSDEEIAGDMRGPTRDLLAPIDVAGKSFVPFVRESMSLVCDLDILFLRKEDPGRLISQGGDIDNRIKTLLDGLRMPNSANEIGNHRVFRPTNCLLESDTLITGLNVRTDRLLDSSLKGNNVVHLVIGVSINVVHVRPYNMRLMGI